ncbi:glycosyltransferase family 2 protein [Rhodococcus sp. LW-XY12]|uniref:glycosyltransferase n=1 Tax=Rhodococcus sp. LW-XY12 TaxID=2856851 RepID=UPI001C581520|nr:glycosyltransferase [Rhodococcus sp. LW-XY12]
MSIESRSQGTSPADQAEDAQRIAVAIATFRRNDLLLELLNSLESATERHAMHVIVADNDPEGGAKEVCSDHPLKPDYIHVTDPGIVPARNASLSKVSSDDDYIAFVDDDETVCPRWLDMLVTTAATHDADVVAGPVVSEYAEGTSQWVVRGNFHQRPRQQTGTPVSLAATNNSLVRRTALMSLENPRFSSDFSETGGSDSELFWRMGQNGARFIWCDEAEVTELVPLDRSTFKWIFRRGIRLGNVYGRLLLREHGRLYVSLAGIARIGLGLVKVTGDLALRRAIMQSGISTLTRGIGILGAQSRKLIHEYRRS